MLFEPDLNLRLGPIFLFVSIRFSYDIVAVVWGRLRIEITLKWHAFKVGRYPTHTWDFPMRASCLQVQKISGSFSDFGIMSMHKCFTCNLDLIFLWKHLKVKAFCIYFFEPKRGTSFLSFFRGISCDNGNAMSSQPCCGRCGKVSIS